MPSPPSALKKSLVQEGFEIYRTSPSLILLADRVRDNLLMDAGVAVVDGTPLAVRVVLRAQATDFPGEAPESLFARARALGDTIRQKGYQELRAEAVPVRDPSDRSRTLDTWYEVSYELSVADEPSLFAELRFALGVRKTAERG
ncbi:MAG TPA: hypothetical protein VGK73_02505 [Polyangiaceae bacterium]